jgi:hypothetical protein
MPLAHTMSVAAHESGLHLITITHWFFHLLIIYNLMERMQ